MRCVVICLKNRTFAVSQTTLRSSCKCIRKLWFAWKIVLLQYRKQRTPLTNASNAVVICLKNRTFAVSQTTQRGHGAAAGRLWFAWKIVLLQYRKQLNQKQDRIYYVVICLKNRTFAVSQTTFREDDSRGVRCDLLEKSYFCSIANNKQKGINANNGLWFAWKIVLLQYRKQLGLGLYALNLGCDLLEKSYFCSIANNIDLTMFYEH